MKDQSFEIINYIANIIKKKGDTISIHDYYKLKPKYSRYQIEKYHDSWSNAVIKAIKLLNDDGKEIKKLKDISNVFKNENKKLITQLKYEQVKTDSIIEACKSAILKLDIKTVKIPKHHTYKTTNQEMHVLRSDEQIGMLVDKKGTQGISEYNFKTYIKYLNTWLEKVLHFKEIDSKSLGLNKLVIARLGDHVEGESIYPGQPFHIDQPVVDQIFEGVKYEVEVLLQLAKVFNKIDIFCVCGNHGRIGKKGQHHERTNWDYIFNRVLKEMLIGQKNINIYISSGPAMVIKNGNFNFLYKHGDGVPRWMGIPFYGLDRDYKKMQILYNMIIHYQMVGHFHQPANITDQILINGSFPGGNEFSINKLGIATRPSQKLFYFDKKYGINRESNIYLNKQWELNPDEFGIYTIHDE